MFLDTIIKAYQDGFIVLYGIIKLEEEFALEQTGLHANIIYVRGRNGGN